MNPAWVALIVLLGWLAIAGLLLAALGRVTGRKYPKQPANPLRTRIEAMTPEQVADEAERIWTGGAR